MKIAQIMGRLKMNLYWLVRTLRFMEDLRYKIIINLHGKWNSYGMCKQTL